MVRAGILAGNEDRLRPIEVTVPLPTPIVSIKAVPLDSWHMLEQSGRLFVPSCLTNS